VNAALNETPAESPDLRIAQALQARGRLKDVDLARAQRLQADAGGSLTGLLLRLGMVSERDMAESTSEVLGLPLVLAKDCPEAPPANVSLSVRFMKQQSVCPIGEDEQQVDLLVADPLDGYAVDAVQLATGRGVRVRVGLRSEIADLFER
jgi:general secretion pathway protein E